MSDKIIFSALDCHSHFNMSHLISHILPNHNTRNLIKRNMSSLPATINGLERLYLATDCTNNITRPEQKYAGRRFNKTNHLQIPEIK